MTLHTLSFGVHFRLNGRQFGLRNWVYEEAGAPETGDVCRIRCLPTSKLVLAFEVSQRHSAVGSGSK